MPLNLQNFYKKGNPFVLIIDCLTGITNKHDKGLFQWVLIYATKSENLPNQGVAATAISVIALVGL